jgi:phytoene dehydrogenase-like protein
VSERFDVAIVGAGFGGLSTALSLAQRGARVVLFEALAYPGGCASTFTRAGVTHESGATLFSGFDANQLWGRWIRELPLEVEIDFPDPVVTHVTPARRLEVRRDRGALFEQLSAVPGAPVRALEDFFALQAQVADVLWGLFDRPEELPPQSASGLLWHARRLRDYAKLVGFVGKPLVAVLARFGLERFEPLCTYLDALCQITVQCSAREAEATFALAAMDYYHRGTGHVRGGIGRLADAIVARLRALGGTVRFSDSVRRVTQRRGGYRIEARRGDVEAGAVALNLLPQAAMRLAEIGPRATERLHDLSRKVETGWGAAMLYLVARSPADAPVSASHFDLVLDEGAPFTDGNHVFVSIGAADDRPGAEDARSITVSTHVSMNDLLSLGAEQQRARIEAIQSKMDRCVATLLPRWWDGLTRRMTASPRTFARFTMRPGGFVGGIPRRAGLANYENLGPLELERNLFLVGDTAFPGQSTLATSVGGVRLAARIASGRSFGEDRPVSWSEDSSRAPARPAPRARSV